MTGFINQGLYSLEINPLSANPTKWSNTLKQLVGKLATNCLSVFDHFVKLALKGCHKLREKLRYMNFLMEIRKLQVMFSIFCGN